MKILDKPCLNLRHSRTVSTNPQTAIVSPVLPASIEKVQSKDVRSHGFQPGISGNPGGRPKTRLLRNRLLRVLKQEDGQVQVIDRVVQRLADVAITGRNPVQAFEAIRDTIDGKPSSDSDGTGGQAIIVNTVFVTDDSE